MRCAPPFAITPALLALACRGGAPDAAAGAGIRDSAGIEIVENSAPAWGEADAWRLSDEPTLTLGGTEGDSAREFYRIAGVARLSDGTIVVANGGTQELRYFAPDGALLRTAGRKGGGPGEFRMLLGMSRVAGDTLVAQDVMQRRLSLFDAGGRHVRDVSLAGADVFFLPQVAGRFADGTWLAQLQTTVGPAMLDRPVGPARDSVRAFRLDAGGAVMDTLGIFPDGRLEVHRIEMMGRALPMPIPVPLSPGTVIRAGSDHAFVGTNDQYEIRVLNPDGSTQRLIRRAHRPHVVTDADKERFRERTTRAMGRQANMPGLEAVREAMAGVPFPEVTPAYSLLMVDAAGNLWVADFATDEDQPGSWSVFDTAGRWLGTVVTPPGLRVREIGADYVLGQMSDEMEIERVVMYRLVKPGG
jgi:hypothetical protein